MPSAMPLDLRDVLASDVDDVPGLTAAIERRWPCAARLVQTVPVRAEHEGRAIDAVVHVFDLEGSSKAARAYAWTAPIDGTARRRIQVSLHIGPIKSPNEAVWAAVADDVRARRLAARQPVPIKAKAIPRHRWLAPKLQALGF
jgi:hypothetical protein